MEKKQDGLALPLSLPPFQSVGSLPSLSCRRQEALWGCGLGLGLPAGVVFAQLPWQP